MKHCIYLIKEVDTNWVKIGTTGNITDRLKKYFTHNPHTPKIICKTRQNCSYKREKQWQRKLQQYALRRSGEWCYISDDMVAAIRDKGWDALR